MRFRIVFIILFVTAAVSGCTGTTESTEINSQAETVEDVEDNEDDIIIIDTDIEEYNEIGVKVEAALEAEAELEIILAKPCECMDVVLPMGSIWYMRPGWSYGQSNLWDDNYLIIEILSESGVRAPVIRGSVIFPGFNRFDGATEFYYVGYYINVIMASRPIHMPAPAKIYMPDTFTDQIEYGEKFFIELYRIGHFNSVLKWGIKHEYAFGRRPNTGNFLHILPIADDRLIFTEQFKSATYEWFRDNSGISPDFLSVARNRVFTPLLSPRIPPPMFGRIIEYNEQVLRGDWTAVIGVCDKHRREFRVEGGDRLFHDGMTVDQIKRFFESMARASADFSDIQRQIDEHIRTLPNNW